MLNRVDKLEQLADSQDRIIDRISRDIDQVGIKCGILRRVPETRTMNNSRLSVAPVDVPGMAGASN